MKFLLSLLCIIPFYQLSHAGERTDRPDVLPIDAYWQTEEALSKLRDIKLKLFNFGTEALSVETAGLKPTRPFADFEKVKSLIFSAETSFDSLGVKTTLAENLPDGVEIVVLGNDSYDIDSLMKTLSKKVSKDRIRKLEVDSNAVTFWTRDVTPIPVFVRQSESSDETLAVTSAPYYHGTDDDETIAKKFDVNMFSHSYLYEGGNFAQDTKGNCFLVVNPRTKLMPDNLFKSHYGCESLTRLPFEKGIGHIDERVRIISDSVVVTDSVGYKKIFEEKGYEVHMVPQAKNYYETHANSLMINGTIFMPVFGQSTDAEAQAVYEKLGFKVVPVNTSSLSNNGHGSIHCITMAYPEYIK